jgi:hypothetical protein
MESQAMHNIFAIVFWAFAIVCLVGALFAWSGWMVKRHTRRMNMEQESLGLNLERLLSSSNTPPTITGLGRIENRIPAGETTEQIKAGNKLVPQGVRKRQGLKSEKMKNAQRGIRGGKNKTDFLLVATL